MQNAYRVAVEEWMATIRHEEALASVNHSVAEIDKWEQAHFKEDEIRGRVKAAKNGTPSDEFKKANADFHPIYMTPFDGFFQVTGLTSGLKVAELGSGHC